MQVLIAISGFCGFCSRIGNTPCTTPFDFLFVISIHVPAWGTTADVSKTDSTFQKDFNPRSRVGNDVIWFSGLLTVLKFQSTFPRGERRDPSFNNPCQHRFQSTFPRGERLKCIRKSDQFSQFQSTFPRGERPHLMSMFYFLETFQSTFPRGERHTPTAVSHQGRSYFNPRSLVGNDDLTFFVSIFGIISIHVPSWGTTAHSSPSRSPSVNFNPRSLVGNDSKFSQIFFAFLCNKYNFSTFYYPFSLFFGVIHFTFLIFVVRTLPIFYVYF